MFGGYDGTHLNETWLYSPSRPLCAYVNLDWAPLPN